MHITRSLLITVCLFLPAQVWAQPASDNANIPQPPAGAGKPMAGMGMLVGEVSDRAATIQVRLTATDKLVDRDVPGAWGVVHFQLYENGSNEPLAESLEYALPQRDFLTRAKFSGLKPDTQYECRSRIGLNAKELAAGPSSSFRTHAGASKEAAYKFVVVTGMNYAKFHGDKAIDMVQHQRENNSAVPKPYSGPDKYLGYPALATILKMQPDFFIGTGDNVYYDTPDATRATTPDEMRRKWHEQFIQPRYLDLFAKVPTMWMVDDHDYRIDDADNAGSFLPLPATSFAMMLEQIPYGAYDDPAPKTYRTFRVCKDLQIWLPENRLYRTPNAALDDSSKTVWGAEQKAWLKRTLSASDATFKILVSPTPMIGPDDKRKNDNHVDIGGFQTEQMEFFDFLKAEGLDKGSFYMVCGDRHWQYHAVNPRGLEEFSCGALVDANSRLGRLPGDPAGTDPEGKIRHLHTQTEPSGGFLMVSIKPTTAAAKATLTFSFYDEKGKLLYEESKVVQ